MMDAIREYLMRVTAVAMICGAALHLCGNLAVKRCLKLCCGLCMMLVLLVPVVRTDTSALLRSFNMMDLLDADITGEAQGYMQEQMSAIISEQTVAYILDKVPQACDVGIEVQTKPLSDYYCVPAVVTVSGASDPALQMELSKILREDLGLTEEQIQWKAE